MDLLFDINLGLIIWTIASFIVLLFVLSKFAWKPILTALDNRENKIKLDIEQAKEGRAKAEELAKLHQEKLFKAEEECKKIIFDGKQTAEKIKEEILIQAKQQAQQELQKAREQIQHDIEDARLQLRTEIADIAIKAVEKILEETLDVTRHKKIVDNMIDKIPKN